MASKAWVGVDLDGTLAEYYFWKGPGHIGDPIPAMVEHVRGLIDSGHEVKIFTARVSRGNPGYVEAQKAIFHWTKEVFGRPLDATAEKDMNCIAIYDDRAFRVETNTGRILSEPEKIEADTGELDFDKLQARERLAYQIWSCLELGRPTSSMATIRMGPEQLAKAQRYIAEYERTKK